MVCRCVSFSGNSHQLFRIIPVFQDGLGLLALIQHEYNMNNYKSCAIIHLLGSSLVCNTVYCGRHVTHAKNEH